MTPNIFANNQVVRANLYIYVFVMLQVLDVATTLIGFSFGLAEASPFIRLLLIDFGPFTGLIICKTIGVGIFAFLLWTKRNHGIFMLNCWCSALVLWNIATIILVLNR